MNETRDDVIVMMTMYIDAEELYNAGEGGRYF